MSARLHSGGGHEKRSQVHIGPPARGGGGREARGARGRGGAALAYPSKFAVTTVPFEVVPARGKAVAETVAATERMETIVDVACILKRRERARAQANE